MLIVTNTLFVVCFVEVKMFDGVKLSTEAVISVIATEALMALTPELGVVMVVSEEAIEPPEAVNGLTEAVLSNF